MNGNLLGKVIRFSLLTGFSQSVVMKYAPVMGCNNDDIGFGGQNQNAYVSIFFACNALCDYCTMGMAFSIIKASPKND